ncbi:MAG: cytosine permease [Actinomycetota bacterium]
MPEIRKEWSAAPIGFRDAQLESSDFTAAMAVLAAGMPALLVGAELTGIGVSVGQLILTAPFGALLGAALVGLLGRQASASGAPGAYLVRPAFGSLGGLLVTAVRLALTLAWSAIILQFTARWAGSALASLGLALGPEPIIVALAILGALLFISGPVWATHKWLRHRLFAAVMVVTVVAAWQVLRIAAPAIEDGFQGGFFDTFDAMLGLSVLWAVVASDLGGYGRREQDTGAGLGYGYGVATLIFTLGGAGIASRMEGDLGTMTGMGAGMLGAVLLLVWIPVVEVDGVGGLAMSSTNSIQTVFGFIPPRFWLLVSAAVSAGAAIVVPQDVLRGVAHLAVSLMAPAVAVILVDSYLIRGGPYSADELFRWFGEYGGLNPIGVGSWLAGGFIALWLLPRPEPTDAWLEDYLAAGPQGAPGLLLATLVGAVTYLLVGKLVTGRRGRTSKMRRF